MAVLAVKIFARWRRFRWLNPRRFYYTIGVGEHRVVRAEYTGMKMSEPRPVWILDRDAAVPAWLRAIKNRVCLTKSPNSMRIRKDASDSPTIAPLGEAECCVWSACLDWPESLVAAWSRILSPDE